MKKLIMITSILVLGTALANTMTVSAADNTTKANVEIIKATTGGGGSNTEFPVGPPIGVGDFTINAISDFDFGKIEMGKIGYAATGKVMSIPGHGNVEQQLGIEMIDQRGEGTGWDIKVGMSDFKSTKNSDVIKGWKLTIPKGKVQTKYGDLANMPVAKAVSLDNTSKVSIFSAASGKGLGVYTNVFATKATIKEDGVKLEIPAYAKTGSYKADLTWTLSNTPGI